MSPQPSQEKKTMTLVRIANTMKVVNRSCYDGTNLYVHTSLTIVNCEAFFRIRWPNREQTGVPWFSQMGYGSLSLVRKTVTKDSWREYCISRKTKDETMKRNDDSSVEKINF
jgi:hypothetical protein